ncbi:hypothetical protein GCM10025859_66270 [Alicyclobacillus fastidiosus]|nr:hypothetical protein GCM10025859_66270 [Alicyclobacillus fastidiosus]
MLNILLNTKTFAKTGYHVALLSATFFRYSRHNMSQVIDFYQAPQVPDYEESIDTKPQTPYDNPKFYHAMRLRLLNDYDLPCSAIAVLIGLHMICDPDTGVFMRSDTQVRKEIGLAKSTYSIGFSELLGSGLVSEIDEARCVITDFEKDRCFGEKSKQNYFRITRNFLRILSRLVAHGHKRMMHFALECLDRSRHYNSENVISMSKLVRERRLGTCPKRALQALSLLDGFMDYAVMPNSTNTDNLVQFWLVKEDQRDEEQIRLRTLHGEVSTEIRESYRFAHGTERLTWRELSRMTRKLIQYGLTYRLYDQDQRLDGRIIKRMAGRFGAMCARNNIKKRIPYLSYILKNGDLEQSIYKVPA